MESECFKKEVKLIQNLVYVESVNHELYIIFRKGFQESILSEYLQVEFQIKEMPCGYAISALCQQRWDWKSITVFTGVKAAAPHKPHPRFGKRKKEKKEKKKTNNKLIFLV